MAKDKTTILEGSRPISKQECSQKMQLRTALVSRKYEDIAEQAGAGTPTFNYFAPMSGRQQRNAYIFTTNSLLQILFGTDNFSDFLTVDGLKFINNKLDKKCPTNIIAILGAHTTDDSDNDISKGQSTVILVPANESKTSQGEYHTIPLPHIINNRMLTMKGSKDSETIGVEFPPSAVIENPSATSVAITKNTNVSVPHSFKVV